MMTIPLPFEFYLTIIKKKKNDNGVNPNSILLLFFYTFRINDLYLLENGKNKYEYHLINDTRNKQYV